MALHFFILMGIGVVSAILSLISLALHLVVSAIGFGLILYAVMPLKNRPSSTSETLKWLKYAGYILIFVPLATNLVVAVLMGLYL